MTIENLLNIIDGSLINKPQVTKIESATIYPSKVELGDLFIAYEKEEISKAIENGAYAIVFEGKTPEISDGEIAYIKVDSLKDATVKFLRYVLLQKEGKIYYFNPVEFALFKQLTHRKSTLFTLLNENWQKSFEIILNSDYELFITQYKEDAQNLSVEFNTLEKRANGYIVNDTLLKTTFKVDGFVYQNMDLTPLFFDNLLRVIAFCKDHQIEYDINRLHYTNDFLPYYIEDDLTPVYRGGSDKVLIFSNSLSVINSAVEYLRSQSKWIKSIALTPVKTKLETISKPNWYTSVEDAKKILKKEFYNYAFCYQLKPNDILNRTEEDINTLF